jgi:hypothetical protein
VTVAGAIIFEKRTGKYDAMFVAGAGGVDEVACPKQRPIPHDMFHYAVETALQKRGFMHRFAAGEGAGFRMAPEGVSEAVERLVETMQADSWSGRPDPAEVIDLFHTTCAARGDVPFALDAAAIEAIRAEIDALARRWDAVPVGGRLELMLGDR